jgi:hypothetical protein
MVEGVNSSTIYCNNFCKCHNVPPPSTLKKKKKKKTNNNKTVVDIAKFKKGQHESMRMQRQHLTALHQKNTILGTFHQWLCGSVASLEWLIYFKNLLWCGVDGA